MSRSSGVIESLGSRRSIHFSLIRAADSHFSPSLETRTRRLPSPPTCASDSRKEQYHLSRQRIRSVKALCSPLSQILVTETISGGAASAELAARATLRAMIALLMQDMRNVSFADSQLRTADEVDRGWT